MCVAGRLQTWHGYFVCVHHFCVLCLMDHVYLRPYALQVFTTAMELPQHFLRRYWHSLVTLLAAVLLASWWVTTGLVLAILQVRLCGPHIHLIQGLATV
jgi:hypothetical protein